VTTGNVEDLWEVRLSPVGFAAGAVFEFFYARVFLPNAVAMSALAFGAGFEFGATPAVSEDAMADYLASAANLKNVNGTVTNSPLSGITTPAGGQDFWVYILDTSALTVDARRVRRLAARQAALSSIR
jgi:hypothetical protein